MLLKKSAEIEFLKKYIIHDYDLENNYHFRKISFEEQRDETISYGMFISHDSTCICYVCDLIDVDILCVW